MDELLDLDKQWETLYGTTPMVDELIDAAKRHTPNAADGDGQSPEHDPLQLIKEM